MGADTNHQQDPTAGLTEEQIAEVRLGLLHKNLDDLELSTNAVALDLASIEVPTGLSTKEQLRIFGKLHKATKRLEAVADKAKKKRDAMNDRTLEALEEIGLQNAPLADLGVTVFKERTLWAGTDKVDDDEDTDSAYERACQALKEAGLDEFVQTRFNVQSLSGYFREREKELEAAERERLGLGPDAPVVVDLEQVLPEPLRGAVKLTENVKAKAKQS